MNKASSAAPDEGRSLWPLAWPAIIWITYFLWSYGAVSFFCGMVARFPSYEASLRGAIFALGAVAISAIAAAAWRGWIRYKLPEKSSAVDGAPDGDPDGDSVEDRDRFLGFAVLLISGLSVTGTIYLMLSLTVARICQ